MITPGFSPEWTTMKMLGLFIRSNMNTNVSGVQRIRGMFLRAPKVREETILPHIMRT